MKNISGAITLWQNDNLNIEGEAISWRMTEAQSADHVGGTKLGTRWATSVTGDVYLYWLGYTTATWYQLNPLQVDAPRIWKYTPSTGVLVPWDELADRLGAIENGTY